MANLKKVDKAVKIVTKATTVFDQAISKIAKANVLLESEIAKDEVEIFEARERINDLNAEILGNAEAIEIKKNEIEKNNKLVEELRRFSK